MPATPTPDDSDEFELDDSPEAPRPATRPVAPRAPAASFAGDGDGDGDDDYEVEELDHTIAERLKQRTAEDLARANESLEIDEAQRSMEERHVFEPEDLEFKFQFQVKHLLILTAVVSLVLGMREFFNGSFAAVLIVLTLVGLIATHAYLSWKERKRFEEASARRAAVLRRIRERQAAQLRGEPFTMYDEEVHQADAQFADDQFADAAQKDRFRFQFSMRDLMIAMTVAAVVMGFASAVGSFTIVVVVLGLIAIAGLAAYGMGFEPPQPVVMVWWMTLVLYILACLARAAGLTFGGG